MNDEITQNQCLDCQTPLILKVIKDKETKEFIGMYSCGKCGAEWLRENYFVEQDTGIKKRHNTVPEKQPETEKNKTEEDITMSTKGKCMKCGRENISLPVKDLCGKCYYESRKDKPKKESKTKKMHRTEVDTQKSSPLAKLEATLQHNRDNSIIDKIRVQFDIEIQIKNIQVINSEK